MTTFRAWLGQVDLELAALGFGCAALDLPGAIWFDWWRDGVDAATAAREGVTGAGRMALANAQFDRWLADVDRELGAQGYPPSCDLFMGGWRDLWAAGLTPAEAVPVGIQKQGEAVSGFYHDQEEEG